HEFPAVDVTTSLVDFQSVFRSAQTIGSCRGSSFLAGGPRRGLLLRSPCQERLTPFPLRSRFRMQPFAPGWHVPQANSAAGMDKVAGAASDGQHLTVGRKLQAFQVQRTVEFNQLLSRRPVPKDDVGGPSAGRQKLARAVELSGNDRPRVPSQAPLFPVA